MNWISSESGRKAVGTVLLVICLASGAAFYLLAVSPDQAVIVTVSGARADTFWQLCDEEAGPLLKSLIAGGVKAEYIDTVDPPTTPVAHTSLFSGAAPPAFDSSLSAAGVQVETLFTVLASTSERPVLFIDSTGGVLKGLELGATIVHADRDFRSEGLPAGQSLPMNLLSQELSGAVPVFSFVSLPMAEAYGQQYGHDSREYREAIAAALEQLERLLQNLNERLLLDRTVVVITADHGMPGPDDSDASEPTNQHIPLIMSGPGFKSGCVLEGGSIIDVAPTLAEVMNVETPSASEGAVLTQAMKPAHNPLWSIIAGASLVIYGVLNLYLSWREKAADS